MPALTVRDNGLESPVNTLPAGSAHPVRPTLRDRTHCIPRTCRAEYCVWLTRGTAGPRIAASCAPTVAPLTP